MKIRVEPLRRDWIEALILSDEAFTDQFGVPVAPGWAGFPESLPVALEAMRQQDCDPWGPQLFFDVDGTLVRFGGFKGPPIDHSVEIGYAVAPSRQGSGVATAATRELISRAHTAGVRVVVAHTLAESSASTSVLERCGFAQIATTSDPDDPDGPAVWRWEARLG